MVDVPRLGVRADHNSRNAQAVAVLVHYRGHDMVVEATPVIPSQENGGRAPVGTAHDSVDQARYIALAIADGSVRMLADLTGGHHPGHRRQTPAPGCSIEVVDRLDIAELPVGLHRVEIGQRIPDARCVRILGHGRARHRSVVLAIRFGPRDDVIAPGNPIAVQ